MSSFPKQAGPSPQRVLDAKPLRLFEATPEEAGPGQWRLTVHLKPRRWRGLRGPRALAKTFELDDIGKAVWESCDGRTSVRDLIEQLATGYNLNVREVEV